MAKVNIDNSTSEMENDAIKIKFCFESNGYYVADSRGRDIVGKDDYLTFTIQDPSRRRGRQRPSLMEKFMHDGSADDERLELGYFHVRDSCSTLQTSPQYVKQFKQILENLDLARPIKIISSNEYPKSIHPYEDVSGC